MEFEIMSTLNWKVDFVSMTEICVFVFYQFVKDTQIESRPIQDFIEVLESTVAHLSFSPENIYSSSVEKALSILLSFFDLVRVQEQQLAIQANLVNWAIEKLEFDHVVSADQNEVSVCRSIILESYMESLDQENPESRDAYCFLEGRVRLNLFEQVRASSCDPRPPLQPIEPLQIPQLQHEGCPSPKHEEVNSFNNRSTSENTPNRVSSSRLEHKQMDEETLGKRAVRQSDEMVEEPSEVVQKGEKVLSGHSGREDDEFSFKDSSN